MKKRLLLILVVGLSFAQPVLGASSEKTGEMALREIKGRAGVGIECKEHFDQAKVLESEFRTERQRRGGDASDAKAAL